MELPINYDDSHWSVRKKAREIYKDTQDNKCYFCKCCLNEDPPEKVKMPIDWSLFPKNFLKWPVHLHHDHKTGMTIGAVHAYCNAILWQYHGE